jgi:hypothetical protein
MDDKTRSAGIRHTMTPHEMLEASARLGARPRVRRFAAPISVEPPKYDESGYPIFQSRRSLTSRVRRLLRG